ncbi:MAG: glycosyltransferase [Acidobacteriota bacterium]
MTAAVLIAYYALLCGLALYGVHRLVLLGTLARPRRAPAETPSLQSAEGELPRVTVQLPIYNERLVAGRLLAAAANLDYPAHLLDIQVLDDSTDSTSDLLAAQVGELRAKGLDVHHVRRTERAGYKAGALAEGLRESQGELVAIFDADFVPPPDFLRRTVPYFQRDDVGMVQACWGHINRRSSLLTRAQAALLDGHFLVEHQARARAGRFFNFNGTAGIWRRAAIVGAGNWQHDTLTEDLDLSYRAQLAGWRFVFLPDLIAPAELPPSLTAFKSQQSRWTRGSVQTLRKLGRRILSASEPRATRAEALAHLTSNFCYVMLVALAALFFPALWLRRELLADPLWTRVDLALLLASTGAVALFYLESGRRAARGLVRSLVLLPAVMALGTGLSLHNALAALGGLRQRGGEFVRTPKARDEGSGPVEQTVYVARPSWSTPLEVAFASYLGACLGGAIVTQLWFAVPFLALFCGGFSWVGLGSLAERRFKARPSQPSSQPAVAQAARAA